MPSAEASKIESDRQQEFVRAIAAAARSEESGAFDVEEEEEGGEVVEGGGGGEEAEGDDFLDDPWYDPVETLQRNRAAAAMALAADAAGTGTEGGVNEIIQERANSLNFYLLQALFQLMAFDLSTFGLLTWLTLPIYDVLLLGIGGYELYNALTRNKSMIPYFPELTWESLTMPGKVPTKVPLPQSALYVLVLWIILGLVIWNIVWGGIFGMVLYAMSHPLATLGIGGDIFSSFFSSLVF